MAASTDAAVDPLDRTYLQKNYFDLGCGDVLVSVCRLYLDSAPRKIEQLQHLLQRNDAEPVISLLHGLKGESGSVGAQQVMALAATLEKAARGGDLESVRTALPDLKQQLQQVVSVITREFLS